MGSVQPDAYQRIWALPFIAGFPDRLASGL
jgi:hypothetical protein